MEIDVAQTLARRAEALLDRRIRILAQEGKSITYAFYPPTPVKMRPLLRSIWT